MARTYRRDARGRFASGGYSGQTGGRGARLKSGGNVRAGGGAKVKAAAAPMRGGVIAKGGNGVRGSVARSLAAVSRKPSTKPAPPPPIPAKLLKSAASTGRKARAKAQGPMNKVVPSPRRHNAAEAAYWEIKHGKGKSKFRSDTKVRAEMQRRGFLKGAKDPQDALIRIASSARRKRGSAY